MSRKPIVVANWKMHKTLEGAVSFALNFKKHVDELVGVDMGIGAAAPLLEALSGKLKGMGTLIFGQNMHEESEGAFTGEISASMLCSVGCQGVILGHSERRHIFGETDEQIAKKVAKALESNLIPILCVGETLAQRNAGNTHSVIGKQIQSALAGIESEALDKVVVAYEPVWAIGTGETATPEMAQDAHAFIRQVVAKMAPRHISENLRIQYGGSVKPSNAQALMKMPDIDGALVGGAGLDVESLVSIGQAASSQPA